MSIESPVEPVMQQVLYVDVAHVANSAQALSLLQEAVSAAPGHPVALNGGNLLLSQKVLLKMNDMLSQHHTYLDMVYAALPQTQQAALDVGLSVRECPASMQPAEESSTLSEPAGDARSAGPALPFGDTLVMDDSMLTPILEQVESLVPTTLKKAVASASKPNVQKRKPVSRSVSTSVKEVEQESSTALLPTMYYESSLRSGKVLRYDGNLIVIGDAHGGSELSATGSIVVWGELQGIAHAGVNGNLNAEIRALKIEAIQLRIGDLIARRPDRVFNHKPTDSSSMAVTPEVARVVSGEIQIFHDVIGK